MCVCVCVCLSGVPLSAFICQFVCFDWRNKDIYNVRGCNVVDSFRVPEILVLQGIFIK